jgi:hypothetical protein
MGGRETTGCTWQQGVFKEEESEEERVGLKSKLSRRKRKKKHGKIMGPERYLVLSWLASSLQRAPMEFGGETRHRGPVEAAGD